MKMRLSLSLTLPLLLSLHAEEGIFLVHHADVDADIAGGRLLQREPRIAGVLQRRIGALQEQAFLRVQEYGLARRDVEKLRVEFIDAIEEPAPAAVGLAGGGDIGFGIRCVIPARRRNFRD